MTEFPPPGAEPTEEVTEAVVEIDDAVTTPDGVDILDLVTCAFIENLASDSENFFRKTIILFFEANIPRNDGSKNDPKSLN